MKHKTNRLFLEEINGSILRWVAIYDGSSKYAVVSSKKSDQFIDTHDKDNINISHRLTVKEAVKTRQPSVQLAGAKFNGGDMINIDLISVCWSCELLQLQRMWIKLHHSLL